MSNGSNSWAEFGINLYLQVIQSQHSKNVVISPYGSRMVLGLAFLGASSSTKEEMAAILKFPDHKASAAEYFKQKTLEWKKQRGLVLANKIYIQSGHSLDSIYVETVQKSFESSVESIDFSHRAKAVKHINSSFESRTNKKIKTVLEPNDLIANPKIVLVDAIHFKGFWKTGFNADMTKKGDFWINEEESVSVDMMVTRRITFPCAELDNLDATVVELPFSNDNASMLVILPRSKTGLNIIEENLGEVDVIGLRKTMGNKEVTLTIPKFSIEFGVDLVGALEQIGFHKMVADYADFSDLLKRPSNMNISNIIHKAAIVVNENGTPGKDSDCVIVPLHPRHDQLDFNADHPFMYIILLRDEIAFIGRIVNFQPKLE
ncbi:unnamed protein product [Hermetia illucens]|uniref:Serpin domain-containing protein n=1 Tax=Hermetia illucens TaxID=343691 RepID=A0A7R8YT26_HERIL|nr:unnamed protein product [Hermetia illucens]